MGGGARAHLLAFVGRQPAQGASGPFAERYPAAHVVRGQCVHDVLRFEEVLMKTFKQFQEGLTHIGDTLKKVKKDIKSQPGDRPYTQEPGQSPKVIEPPKKI